MRISVIIATYNRAALLDECLAHLARQQFGAGDEVVIVDNGSTDDTLATVSRHRQMFPVPVLYLSEPRPGKSRALATALGVASGDVLAFTDDDVNVEETWIDALRASLRDPEIALVGGPVAPRFERRAPWWLVFDSDGYGRFAAPLALLDYGRQDADLGPRALLGANLAVRSAVFHRVGGFATNLGKLRGTLLSGEDDDFCRRVQAAGFRARYCCDARVWHWVPATRMRLRYFLDWFFWSGITNATLDQGTVSSYPTLFGLPRYLVRRFFAGIAGLPVAVVLGRRAKALHCALDAAFAAGYAAHQWGLVHLQPTDAPVPAGDAA